MSLLMDALRRAERAKEQGQPAQPGEAAPAGSGAGVPPSPSPAPSAADPGTVETGLTLSIDEVVPVPPAPAAAAAATRPDPGPQPKPHPRSATAETVTPDQARRLFTQRARQSRRRRLAVTAGSGVALLVVVLVLVYFEVVASAGRLQGSQVAVPPAPPVGIASVPAVEATNTSADEPAVGATGPHPPARTEPAPAGRAARPAAALAQTVSAPVTPAVRAEPSPPAALPQEAPASPVVIVRNEAVDPLQALLAQAFDDYQAGNDARAEAGYRQALARDANNRDALLGLAALAQRGNRAEEARLYFRHLLELNPLDSAPAAGLIALQGGVNPVNDESRIKLLLRQEPDAAYLHFALGTVYVGQGRWAEAQQAFFDAYRRDPANADHAFNLAVCLDHLGQPRAALEYYRRALDLARGRAAGFSAAQAEQRIETLTKAARGEAG